MSVLISGATGFIAQHIVSDLLKENYKVIGTVRSVEKADKLKRQFGNNPNFILEIVTDVAAPGAFDKIFQKYEGEIKYVLHTASPFFFNTTDYEKDLLAPAVNGTKSILESIKKNAANTVERVVITSSLAAILDLSKAQDGSVVYDESTWNPATWESCQADGINAYCGSKKLAEEAAWKFYNENKESVKFKLSTVNPVYVFGPQLFDEDVKEHLNTSCEFINSLIHNSPGTENYLGLTGQFIDVRDVAKAHLLAFQKEEAIDQRLILSNGQFSGQDMVDVLTKEFPFLKGTVPVGKHIAHDSFPSVNNSKSRKILGFELISFRDTVYDTAAQILKKEGKL